MSATTASTMTSSSENLYTRTPLIESSALSSIAGCRIFLKLENFQPSGSFKYRGISHLMLSALPNRSASELASLHYYCSSGGNAGIACATAAKNLGYPATVVVPLATSAFMVAKLQNLGADVHRVGASWVDADRHLRENLLSKNPFGFYVPPFDDPIIWEGSSSMLEEVYAQFAANGEEGLDGVVCSVGGGSLMTGIMMSMERNPRDDGVMPKILAVETKGAESLNISLTGGKHVALPKITSIATSLGVVRVASKAYEYALMDNVDSIVISDAEAAMAAVKFAEDEKMLIEISCGAAVAPVYSGRLRESMGQGLTDEAWSKKKVVVAVCGGSDVTTRLLNEYTEKFATSVPWAGTRDIVPEMEASSIRPSAAIRTLGGRRLTVCT